MNFQEPHATTLSELGKYLYLKPHPDDLCQYLAINICPTGELARVYVGRLDNDGQIRTAASFGYSCDCNVMEIVTPLDLDRPMPEAIRKKKVVVANKEDVLKNYSNYEPLDTRSPWVSTAIVPTLGDYVFVFRLQCKIEDNTFSEMYFLIVGTLLSLYRFDEAISRSATDKDVKKELYRPRVKKGSPLTERQELIVKLIRDSKTNGQIAIALGYSESLIRQETIIIYQKLGVNGRRDLISISQIVS